MGSFRSAVTVVVLTQLIACAKSEDSVSGGGSGGKDGGALDAATGGKGGTGGAKGGGGGSGGSGGTTPDGGGGMAGASGGSAGAAGAAGAGGSSGDASTGDAGCSSPTECPAPSNECLVATCSGGVCGTGKVPAGTPTATQTVKDCKKVLCDGNGGTIVSNDDTDLPDDNKPCTNDSCVNGVVINAPVTPGTSCGTGLVCDSAGNCGGCAAPTSCPGQDTECATRTCSAGVCGFTYANAGKKLTLQTAGDCKVQQCDGAGNVVVVNDNADVLVDGKQCTSDTCVNGTPANPASSPGTPCTEGGGTVCNGSGTCVACIVASNCPGIDTDCSKRTCTTNVCGTSYTGSGVPTSSQTVGDCKTNVCNGSGGITTTNDNADVPVDGQQCTNDVCTAGVPSNPPLPPGTACSQSGGKVCSSTGTCVECVTGADCASGVCQNNACVAVTCGSGQLDCDGAPGNGCECSGALCCGTACSPKHQNGLGQTYENCAPLGTPGVASTYSVTLAVAARSAWPNTGTDGFASCVGPSGGDVVYRQTATSCAVWGYTKSIAGYVRLNTANNDCLCPNTTYPTWN